MNIVYMNLNQFKISYVCFRDSAHFKITTLKNKIGNCSRFLVGFPHEISWIRHALGMT